MRMIPDDAQNVRNGMESSMWERLQLLLKLADQHRKTIWLPPQKQRINWRLVREWRRFIAEKFHELINLINPTAVRIEELPDDWVYTIASMLSKIKSAALDTLVPPLQYNYVHLTWPDFEADTGIYRIASGLRVA
jgi:hypothetical protein